MDKEVIECEFTNTQNSEYCNMVYMQEINDKFKHYKHFCIENKNCVYKQLIQSQQDLKLEAERNKSFENVRQLLYKEIKDLTKEKRAIEQDLKVAAEENIRLKEYAQRALKWVESDNDISAKLVLRKMIKGEKLGIVTLDNAQVLAKLNKE